MPFRNPAVAADLPNAAKAVNGLMVKRLVWLVYLLMYPLPWFFRAPTPLGLALSGIGIAAFIALYLQSLVVKPRALGWHIAASVLIGFFLSPFGGVWAVFSVYASSFAGRLTPRRRVIAGLVAVQASLLVFGLISGQRLFNWLPAIFFGVMTGFGTAWQSEVEAKNLQLEAAQGEVRALATSAERERIARDLHDLLGHTLTLVAVKADLAARLADRDPARAKQEMEAVAQAARDALGEVRTAVKGMAGAAFSVELDRARRALAAADIAAEVSAATDLNDPAREAVLAMALREAVTNIIRHSGARRCRIALDAGPEGILRLSVEDDGRGGEIQEGSGLRGMRTRLMAAGGELQIRSDAAGARLLASLPGAA